VISSCTSFIYFRVSFSMDHMEGSIEDMRHFWWFEWEGYGRELSLNTCDKLWFLKYLAVMTWFWWPLFRTGHLQRSIFRCNMDVWVKFETSFDILLIRWRFVWMFAFRGLALYWFDCQYPSILILRLNANIYVWTIRMVRLPPPMPASAARRSRCLVFFFFFETKNLSITI
jgi:hypothetical protein